MSGWVGCMVKLRFMHMVMLKCCVNALADFMMRVVMGQVFWLRLPL